MNIHRPLLRLFLLLFSIFLSTLIILGSGLLVVFTWEYLPSELRGNNVSEIDISNIPFIFCNTLASVITACICLYLWKQVISRNEAKLQLSATDNVVLRSPAPIPLKIYFKYCLLIIGLAFVIDFINTRMLHLSDIPQWQRALLGESNNSSALQIMLFIAIVILAPLWEEIVFRGILFSGLALLLPVNICIIITSLFWALLHSLQYSAIFILEIVVIGCVIAGARTATRSLRIPLMMHITNNLIAFIHLYTYS